MCKVKKTILYFIMVLSIFSCNKLKEEITPENVGDDILWTYSIVKELGNEVVNTAIPAYDEKNTGYYLLETDNTGANDINNRHDVWILSLRNDSSLHWKKKVNDFTTDPVDENFVAYSQGKVFVYLTQKLMCLDTTDGHTIWSKDIVRDYDKNSFSVSGNKIFYIDSDDIPNRLIGLNVENGATLINYNLGNGTQEDVRGLKTIIANNTLYVTAVDIDNQGKWLTRLLIFNLSNLSSESVPVEYILPVKTYIKSALIANKSGDAVFIASNDYISTRYVFAVKSTGQEKFKCELGDDYDYLYADNQDNIIAVSSGNTSYEIISSAGSVIKSINFPYYAYTDPFLILDNNLVPFVSENSETGNLGLAYFDVHQGSISFSSPEAYPYALFQGTSIEDLRKNDKREEDNMKFLNSLIKSIDNAGNLLGISADKIFCVKGQQKKIQSNAWAKDFSNLGNTNSR